MERGEFHERGKKMNKNEEKSFGSDAMRVFVLDTPDGALACPIDSAAKDARIRLQGISIADYAQISLEAFGKIQEIQSDGCFELDEPRGHFEVTLVFKRRTGAASRAKLALEWDEGVLRAGQAACNGDTPPLAVILAELARQRATGRRIQKRLRAIERALGSYSWI